MPIQLPVVASPVVNPKTGQINTDWYLALLDLTSTVTGVFVTSVNIAGNNGITVVGSPITSASIITLGIGNLTCASAVIAGTLTAANVVAVASVRAASVLATGTVTAADAVVSASLLSANIRATASITGADIVATASVRAATVTGGTVDGTGVTAARVVVTGSVTAASLALSGDLRLGAAFVAGITGAAGTITVFDSTGTPYKLLVQL